MDDVLSIIGRLRIIPVVTLNHAGDALPLARALLDGGLPLAEITLRTEAGAEALRRIAAEMPDILVGAGTVLTPAQVDAAAGAGARFIVSPGFNPRVVERALAHGLVMIPGCATPSDMEQAMEHGLTTVKFFPAEQQGGVDYLKAVSGPYPALRYVPTGGIGPHNLKHYLDFPRVLACGGSWMVKSELIDAGRFDEITALCREAAALAQAQ
ncbi:MAG TPA: bifunctional 4-hydroxy-2-oxoglutarate aldolase/2-dehydro-3-deoxy-phosphogluconate aldolase [Clostridia bacterium]|nr:bifunctional 4-hydroxy-2-oxoglutarate aldolase/2-dehydro-3-deoxy-phosphogluconate aldolase [Clostridia bacterium]